MKKTIELFKPVLALSAITSMLPSASASVCFITRGRYGTYRNELNCGFTGQEANLMTLIKSACDIYVDNNDCPPSINSWAGWYYYATNYGTGYFGGVACDLVQYIDNGCVMKLLTDNVKSGYGTYIDVLATTGIVAAGIVTVAAVSYGSYRFFHCAKNIAKTNAVAAADERTRLINNDASVTAPSKIAPLIEDNELAVIVHAGH